MEDKQKNEMRDVRAIVRTYKDKETGEDKNVYRTIGTAFVSPHASQITIQLEALPMDKSWNGKLYINKPHEKKLDTPIKHYNSQSQPSEPIKLEDIPF